MSGLGSLNVPDPAAIESAPSGLAFIELAEVEEALALFCEGIAGRYLHIKTTREFDSRRIELDENDVAQAGDSLYLPATLDAPDASAYRVLALEQLGHRECGTYRFSIDAALDRIPTLRDRLPAESRATVGDLTRFFHCFEVPAVARALFLLVEYARVWGHLRRVYPGIAQHANRFYAHQAVQLEAQVAAQLAGEAGEQDPVDQVTREFLPWRWGFIAHQIGTVSPLGEVPARILQVLNDSALPGQDVYDSAERTLFLMEQLDIEWSDAPLERTVDELAEWLQREERLEELEDAATEMKGMVLAAELPDSGELEAELGELGEGAVRDAGLDLKVLQAEKERRERRRDLERYAIADALGRQRPEARSFRYDEWSHLERRYLRHWCRLFEQELVGDADEDVAPLNQVVRAWRPAVQRQLAQMRPLGLQRVRGVQDGDELDLNAVVVARQDIRAGITPDDRVYSRREYLHRDVCAAFLVDLSASTDDAVSTGEAVDDEAAGPQETDNEQADGGAAIGWSAWDDDPWDDEPVDATPKRKVIDVQREAMLVMAAALEELGDHYGIYGFSGYGRDCVEVFVAKEPQQAFSNKTLRAIAAMKPKRSTRMGPAIRHMSGKLAASGNALKVLIVLSDGFPQDMDYGPDRGVHEYGIQDTAKALSEAASKGIETFCVTVDQSGHDYLKRMCPDSRYMVIEDIEDLPGALSKVYGALTGR